MRPGIIEFSFALIVAAFATTASAQAADTVENYISEYPNQEQARMMNAWLAKGNQPGTFRFSGLVDPSDTTVVTPQATVDYGYNWFSISNGPAIPTGKDFYAVLRAYVPVKGADLTVAVVKQ